MVLSAASPSIAFAKPDPNHQRHVAVESPHDRAVEAWNDAVQAIDEVGSHDPEFAGVWSGDAHAGVIYRTSGLPSDLYTAVLRDLPPGIRITFGKAYMSGHEARALIDEIWSQRGEFAAQGIRMTAASMDFAGRVTVGVETLTPEAENLIRSRYDHFDSGAFTVVQQGPLTPAVSVASAGPSALVDHAGD